MEKPGKRKADLEHIWQIILSVTSELFTAEGLKNTSTREIALKANITRPSLYHHFKNKEELYLAAIEGLTSRVKEELIPIVFGNASVKEKLYQLIKVLPDEHPINLFLILSDVLQEMDPDYDRTLYQIFEETYINNIVAIFENGPETNCLQEGISVGNATRFILYSISALLSIEKTYQRKTVDDDVKKFIQFMSHGVLKSRK